MKYFDGLKQIVLNSRFFVKLSNLAFNEYFLIKEHFSCRMFEKGIVHEGCPIFGFKDLGHIPFSPKKTYKYLNSCGGSQN